MGALGVVVGCLGCRTPSPTATNLPESSSAQPSAAPPTAATPSASAPASASAAAVARVGDGCWGVGLPASPEARLSQIGQRCAQGMKPLLPEARKLTLSGEEARLDLPALAAGACVRVVVATEQSASVSLLDAQGKAISSASGGGFVLLDDGGPVCPRKGEGLRLSARGRSEAWVQIWSSAQNPR